MGWSAAHSRNSRGGRRAGCPARSARCSPIHLLDGAVLPRADRRLDDLLRGQALVAGGVERSARLDLRHESIDAVAKGVVEAAHAAAHDRVVDDHLLGAAAREELQPLVYVLDDEAALAAAHLAALDGVQHAGVVAAGEMADRPALELDVDGGVRPDGTPRPLVHE